MKTAATRLQGALIGCGFVSRFHVEGRHSIGEDVATLSLQFAGGCMGLLDMSWCAPADLARAEWALNETVVEGTAGSLRLLTDGSLEWISPTGRRERKPVVLPPDDQVYIDGYTATQQHFVRYPVAEARGLPVDSTGFRGPASTSPTIGRLTRIMLSARSRAMSC